MSTWPALSGWRRAAALLLTALPLAAGCEAGYSLDAIRAEAGKPVQRYDRLQAVAGDAASELIAVGSYGVVLRSLDGGGSWERHVLPGKPPLIDIARCPDGSFAALDFDGGVWLRETAPGAGAPPPAAAQAPAAAASATDPSPDPAAAQAPATAADPDPDPWRRTALPMRDAPLAIHCGPDGRRWVVGEFSAILWSRDGGGRWVDISLGEDVLFTAVHFFDSQRGFIGGEFGAFLTTADGGATWQQHPPIAEDFYVQAAAFLSPQEGWAVGVQGAILHTTDGGQTWRHESAPTQAPLFGAVIHGGVPVVVGGLGTVLVRRGGRWSALQATPPVRGYLRGVASVGPDRLIVVGAGGTQRRIDTAGAGLGPAPAGDAAG